MRSFVKLFDLEILHDYYISGKSDDFVIWPTTDTIKLIKGHRSLFKSRSHKTGSKGTSGAAVIFEETDKLLHTPLIPITSQVRFRFVMELVNPVFLNITDLQPPKTNSAQIYYYDNTGGTPLAQTLMELRPKVFTYKFSSASSPDELKVFGIDGNEIGDLSVALTGGPDFEVQLDLSGYPDGKYRLELFDAGVTTGESELVYFDDQLAGRSVFGIVEIFKSNNVLAGNELKIQFTSSSKLWKYFIVVKDGLGSDSYIVEDAEDGGPYILFDALDPEADPDDSATAASLLAAFPDGDVVLYSSEDPVVYSEAKKEEIQLVKNPPTGPTLILNLPNPEISNPKAEAYVFV